jgi:hypothetical protein
MVVNMGGRPLSRENFDTLRVAVNIYDGKDDSGPTDVTGATEGEDPGSVPGDGA